MTKTRERNPASGPMLCVNRISKQFGESLVLQEITIGVKAGESLGVVGENGAGKSTLLNIIAGGLRPDSGQMLFHGERYAPPSSGRAIGVGIALVHQDPTLFDNLSITENLFIGQLPQIAGILNSRAARKRAIAIMEQLGLQRSPRTIVHELSLAERQLVEIGRALTTSPQLLLLDEPTRALTARQAESLIKVIEQLKKDGMGIILASDDLPEVLKACERIVVLRDGCGVATGRRDEFSVDRMMSLMVGRSLTQFFPARATQPTREMVLEARGVSRPDVVENISFKVHRREIVGLTGLKGSGRSELGRILFGAESARGEILIEGRPRNGNSRIALVSGRENEEGLCAEGSIRDNMLLTNLPKHTRKPLGILNEQELKTEFEALRERVRLSASLKQEQSVENLSGGNQRKVVLARAIAREPALLILDDATSGMDTESKFELYTVINELVSAGSGVLLISSEIEELIGMCDRVLVMHNGMMRGEWERKQFDREQVLRAGLRSLLHA